MSSREVVAQRPQDRRALAVDQERRGAAVGRLLDRVPDVDEVVEVPLQLLGGAADAGGADDGAHAVGDLQRVHRFAQGVAVVAFDAARHAAGARVVRHQHQEPAGQADEGGERGALVAAFFLLDLDDDVLAFLDQVADAAAAAFLAGLLVLEERLGDFLQRQEAVAIGAVVDERSLEAGFDAGDASLVDVGFLGFARRDFDVEVVDPLAVDQRYAQLFFLSCVDEHSFHRPSRYWRLGPRTVRTGSGAVAWGKGLAATARALICCSSAPAQGARCVTESWCCRASYPPRSLLARCPPGLRHLRVSAADRWCLKVQNQLRLRAPCTTRRACNRASLIRRCLMLLGRTSALPSAGM